MVSKRPGNSRDDKSGRSSNRASNGDDKPKRDSSSRGNSSTGNKSRNNNSRPEKKFGGEQSGGGKSFSSSGKKPYQSREAGDKPASSFTDAPGGKRSFSTRNKPYSGRAADTDSRPEKSYGGASSGENRSAPKRNRPYSGRSNDDLPQPKRNFGGESSGEKRSFSPRSKPYGSRTNDSDSHKDDKPKRVFGGDSAGKKPGTSRSQSAPGSFRADQRAKKSAGSFEGDKKFPTRPGAGRGFKKSDKPYDADRPERSKPVYDKITRDRDAPEKTLRGRKKGADSKDAGLIRLNRYISNAGICSRRKADELISAGVVSVNGVVISELGHKVDPQKDEIRYNGEMLKREKMVYVLLNKPKDYITTTEDPQERRTVMHLVEKASKERIYPIGRLDRNTTGLLLMTNDGDLADKLSHPRNNIVKLYQAELSKNLTQGDLNKIAFGLELEDGFIKPDSISYVAGGSKREVGIQVHSGKNRIVRRIFEHLGYEVVKLDRTVYANLNKKDLTRGRWRYLDESEVIMLKHLV
jgi:23S rRNA pseudouridine2605 synthase